ncbi:hypothetical protein V5738_10155 [Salinisphaera sp. SPP-AMP-43]|uniref:hypothetical protein n=1 Tax=Salinisphaera sp. SPP-AMP-43 TaxID=3121288 RepID=UPI003C6E7519
MKDAKNRFGRWPEIRELGFWNFVIQYGVGGWSFRVAKRFPLIVLPVLFVLTWSVKETLLVMFACLVTLPIGGLVWGALFWLFIDHRYKKYVRHQSST